jgi:hypothetical protein
MCLGRAKLEMGYGEDGGTVVWGRSHVTEERESLVRSYAYIGKQIAE